MSVDVEAILRSHGVGVGGGVQIVESETEPTSGLKEGLFWYNPNTQEIQIYVNNEFRPVGGGSGSIATVFRSRYETTSYVSEVPINISDYSPERDILLVHQNSTFITEGEEFTVSDDGNTIIKTEGSWPDGIVFDFTVLAVTFDPGADTGLKLLKLSDHQTVNGDGVTNIPFNIPEFLDGVDILEVHQEEIKLFQGIHWNVGSDGYSIDLNGYTANVGDNFHFEVYKKIRDNYSNKDGSLIMDDSIINAKLHPDIKIGSLSNLNTNEKQSLVGAINELYTLINGS